MLWPQLKKKFWGLWFPCPTGETDSTKGMLPSSHHPQNVMRQPWKWQGCNKSPICFHVGLCGNHISCQSLQPEGWTLISFIKDGNIWVNSSGRNTQFWLLVLQEKWEILLFTAELLCFPCSFWVCMQCAVCMLFPSTWQGSSLCPQQQVPPGRRGKEGITYNKGTREMLIILSVPGNYVESAPFLNSFAVNSALVTDISLHWKILLICCPARLPHFQQ